LFYAAGESYYAIGPILLLLETIGLKIKLKRVKGIGGTKI
jgi:hypothetical protein